MSQRQLMLLSDLSSYEAPAGIRYPVRPYRPGDHGAWEEIMRRSPPGSSQEPVSFDVTLRHHPSYRPQRVLFIEDHGKLRATAAVGTEPKIAPGVGMIWQIASVDSRQAVAYLQSAIIAAIDCARREGFSQVWADGSQPVLGKLLFDLGFRDWQPDDPGHYTDHTDYQSRAVPLYRWNPDRLIAESTGYTHDFRGDESLYHPGSLGKAWIEPGVVQAAHDTPFSLTYEAGSQVLGPGSSVSFWMAGQGSLGTAPQTEASDLPGFVELEADPELDLELLCSAPRTFDLKTGESPEGGIRAADLVVGPVTLGFRIRAGSLHAGRRVGLVVGRQAGFHWKQLADRKEFKVIIDLGGNEPRMRLPEPVRVRITPAAAERVELYLPGSAKAGSELTAVVRVCDAFDNRVAFNGHLAIECGGERSSAYLNQGLATVRLGRMPGHPVQAHTSCEQLGGSWQSNRCVNSESLQLFFGDMHTHDSFSTAEGYTSDCYLWARDEKRLDFQSLPMQVHRWLDNEKWVIAKHLNEYFLDEGRFVTFLAFEWQHSQYGDKVIHYLGGDMPYLPTDDPRFSDPASLYEALRATDAFIISHHPGYALDLHVPGTRWETLEPDVDRLAEIWSMHGSSEGYDPADRPLIEPRRPGGVYDGLRSGLRIGLVGGSDTHTGRPGGAVGEPRPYFGGLCAVWAEELTRRSLFEAFRARRTYALTGARIALRFEVNGHPMGAECPLSRDRSITVSVCASDTIEQIQILKDTAVIHEAGPADSLAELQLLDQSETPACYHCRVKQADGHLAVSSPVWVG